MRLYKRSFVKIDSLPEHKLTKFVRSTRHMALSTNQQHGKGTGRNIRPYDGFIVFFHIQYHVLYVQQLEKQESWNTTEYMCTIYTVPYRASGRILMPNFRLIIKQKCCYLYCYCRVHTNC